MILAFAIAATVLMWRPADAADISKCKQVASGRASVVDIPTTLDDGQSVSLKGLFTTPTGPGPFPAVVMLHGDGSLYTPYCHAALAEQFASWGYATLIIASSTAINDRQVRQYEYSFRDQANHARGAARLLSTMTRIDNRRLAVWGHSRGGLTAIELSVNPRDREGHFKAIISAAPHCPSRVISQHTPLLLIVGTHDAKISFAACKDFAASSNRHTGFEYLFLTGANHVFWLQADAARTSAQRMRAFLAKHLAR